ncbi:DNA-deoxyinosine glycosylase [Mariprofundus erugo]|uniref:DNA-deoxyinosine glycosylase n=1 Tax=Mariprofundus erugo TaxID=2528639 RepID=UPI0010FF499B|nr:DNA-deoxyinosine glycosylase [Mariprofundus erugo]TLS74931.1 DNA-deoxyinosine glycosylase [Mariprofundus erugo]
MLETGFPYSADASARVLILGSMPGRKSLDEQQYYAHPRNAFWPIMANLFGFDLSLPYPARLEQLHHQEIALWDVAHQCKRAGSLDADIQQHTVIANDFNLFFRSHPHIQWIAFNGQKAAELYRRMVRPALAPPFADIPCLYLPSTSPAHASMRLEEKQVQWQRIRTLLQSAPHDQD